MFREGHVPNCERFEEITDPFNDAAGTDPDPDPEDAEADAEDADEASESIF